MCMWERDSSWSLVPSSHVRKWLLTLQEVRSAGEPQMEVEVELYSRKESPGWANTNLILRTSVHVIACPLRLKQIQMFSKGNYTFKYQHWFVQFWFAETHCGNFMLICSIFKAAISNQQSPSVSFQCSSVSLSHPPCGGSFHYLIHY